MKAFITLILLTVLSVPVSAQSISSVLTQKFSVPLKGGIPTRIVSRIIEYGVPDATQSKRISMYNRDGLLTSSESYGKHGELTDKQEYIIDTGRKLVLARIFDGPFIHKKIRDTLFNTYDQNGFVVKQVYMSGGLFTTALFNNDENGFPLTAQVFDTLGNLETNEKAVYQHDKNYYIVTMHSKEGKLMLCDTHKIDFRKPFVHSNAQDKYNEYGNLISYWKKSRYGVYQSETDYEYDARGNWTSMKVYRIIKNDAGKVSRNLSIHEIREIIYQE